MNFCTRISLAIASILLTLVFQVMAIEAVFFPPALPFPLSNSVPIVWNTDDEMALSTSGYHGTRLHRGEAETAIAAVQRSMRSYPQWVLDEHLDQIILVRKLTHTKGKQVGGLASGRRIFLTAGAARRGAFHHELAHVLSQAYRERLDEQQWKTINPPGFQYGCRTGTCRTLQGQLRSAFVSAYAMTNVREDFAETAEDLFSDGYDDTFTGARRDALNRKAAILIEFYRSIDPVFTEEYFRNLS